MVDRSTQAAGPRAGDGRTGEEILRVEQLCKYFPVGGGLFRRPEQLRAVDGVDLSVRTGETVGLVGESGCGKTTLSQTIIRLLEPTEGRIVFDGVDISHLSAGKLKPHRRAMQMVFQDPYSSLDPRMTVRSIVEEPLKNFGHIGGRDRGERVQELLRLVGLNPYFADRYPHEFSGGQRQRIGIARALAVQPKLVLCDEPVSALDVSIQAQVLNLLQDLQEEFRLTYLFIAHNLAVVAHISDRIAVMYLGKIVELAPAEEVIEHPAHPYTKALLSAIPSTERGQRRERIVLSGEVPSPLHPPSGCRFRTRCPLATERCAEEEPAFRALSSRHWAACHYA